MLSWLAVLLFLAILASPKFVILRHCHLPTRVSIKNKTKNWIPSGFFFHASQSVHYIFFILQIQGLQSYPGIWGRLLNYRFKVYFSPLGMCICKLSFGVILQTNKDYYCHKGNKAISKSQVLPGNHTPAEVLPPPALTPSLLWTFFSYSYLFIHLCWVLVAAQGIFVGLCGIFCCGAQTL